MPTPLAAAVAALLAVLPAGRLHASATQVYALGVWRLQVRQDAFTRKTLCTLVNDYGHNPDLMAEPSALVLRLPGHRDGSNAWFSVDGLPARPWRDVEAGLIANGAMAETETLDNSTGGAMPLPYADIAGARMISVRISPGSTIRRYNVSPLWEMASAAARLGCGSFVHVDRTTINPSATGNVTKERP